MVGRIAIAEFGIAQKQLSNASVAIYYADETGASTGVLATLYTDATTAAITQNPQVLDENGMLQQLCFVDNLVVAAISGINETSERYIRKIRANPLEYPLAVTSALIATAIIADSLTAAIVAQAAAAAALASQNSAASHDSNSAASSAAAGADVVLTHADVVLTHADVVLTHADVVLTHADVVTAGASATVAQTSAILAASTFIGTSVSTNTIANSGIVTFSTQTNKSFQGGQFVIASNGINSMTGIVTSYNNSTGALALSLTKSSGSGTFSSWNISISGEPGLDGGGSGTVTSVSVISANGVSASILNPGSTPSMTFTLGAITPSSIVSTGTIAGTNLSGSNTGDQTITLTGDVTGTGTGSFATAIGAGKVTNTMLGGSIAASKFVGTDIATVGTITAGTWYGTKIAEIYGGTNQSAYVVGDIIYSAVTNTLSRLAIGSTGQVLTVVGGVPAWQSPAGASGGQLQFSKMTSSGNFTTSANITTDTWFKFIITGGGGGGGHAGTSTFSVGGGGGSGATAIYWINGLSPSTAYTVTIGAGGTGGTSGAAAGAGGSSSIIIGAATVTAGGGQAAGASATTVATIASGGGGGNATGGTLNIAGGGGTAGIAITTNAIAGGIGGASFWGQGWTGAIITGGGNQAGSVGEAYGSGGSGAAAAATGANGGAGKSGVLTVEWIE